MSRLRALRRWLRPRLEPASRIVFSTAIVFALWAAHRTDDRQRAADRRDAARTELEEAQQCVTSWEVRDKIRDAVERGARGGAWAGAEALIAIATDATPERIAQYREAVDRSADAEVAAARSEIPNPECDLSAARERVERGL